MANMSNSRGKQQHSGDCSCSCEGASRRCQPSPMLSPNYMMKTAPEPLFLSLQCTHVSIKGVLEEGRVLVVLPLVWALCAGIKEAVVVQRVLAGVAQGLEAKPSALHKLNKPFVHL